MLLVAGAAAPATVGIADTNTSPVSMPTSVRFLMRHPPAFRWPPASSFGLGSNLPGCRPAHAERLTRVGQEDLWLDPKPMAA
jgi:hypothetical protein